MFRFIYSCILVFLYIAYGGFIIDFQHGIWLIPQKTKTTRMIY
jgi:hypothetical protein